MKILLTYSSKTGNTKKVADAIYEVMPENTVYTSINHDINLDEFDTVIVGFWVDKGLPNSEAKEFIEKIKGKKVGIFGTLGAYPDSDHAKKTLKRTRELLEPENKVVGEFLCQGKVDPKLTERFKKFPEGHPHYLDEARKKRHEEASKHPNEEDFNNAKQTFEEIVSKIAEVNC